MSYLPTVAGHEDAPLEQEVSVERNERIEQTREMLESFLDRERFTTHHERLYALKRTGALCAPGLRREEVDVVMCDLEGALVSSHPFVQGVIGRVYGEMLRTCGGVLRYALPFPLDDVFTRAGRAVLRDVTLDEPDRNSWFGNVVSIETQVGTSFGDALKQSIIINNADLSIDHTFLRYTAESIFVNLGSLQLTSGNGSGGFNGNTFINVGRLEGNFYEDSSDFFRGSFIFDFVAGRRYFLGLPDTPSLRSLRTSEQRPFAAYLQEFTQACYDPALLHQRLQEKENCDWISRFNAATTVLAGVGLPAQLYDTFPKLL